MRTHRFKFLSKFRRTGGMLLQQQLSSREGSVENTMVFPSKELEKATEGFSLEMVVGRGEVVKGLCLRECKLTEKNRRS
ncbi:hypothetical protein Bca52824_010677 [Brassica carinata]|uniref:Uncharacterized protein n=1 Tax=Brassica carinata TaxID=52824 RepID=A0A8X7WDY2_BRACI|nr:hypothetical protein Bca52824_010677 [Brassica carinata]